MIRQCILATLAFIAVAGCADHHFPSDAIPGSQTACQTASAVDRTYIEQAFEGGVLLMIVHPGETGPIAAYFGPAREPEENVRHWRGRLMEDGVLVDVELDLRMNDASTADSVMIDFEGRFTPPGSEHELSFGAQGLPVPWCG